MTSEVETLYAAAAWKRFDDEISDELLRAVTSAFALIAVADGDLAEAEDAGFLSVLRDHPSSSRSSHSKNWISSLKMFAQHY